VPRKPELSSRALSIDGGRAMLEIAAIYDELAGRSDGSPSSFLTWSG